MASLLKRISELFEENFADASIELEHFEGNSKVSGFVIWAGFYGVDMKERVRLIWKLLEQNLDAKEMRRVSLIMPLTPAEIAVRREELAIEENQIQRTARSS